MSEIHTHRRCAYYTTHVCGQTPVQFLSRYRDESDYCVNGRRITVKDNHTLHSHDGEPVSASENLTLSLYFVQAYADYCIWHSHQKQFHGEGWPALKPFDDYLFAEVAA